MNEKELIEKWESCIVTTDKAIIIDGFIRDLNLFKKFIKDECAEDIRQAVRYYLKYQKSLGMWEDQNEYQKGVQVTCENIQQLIENDFINKVE